MQFKTIKIDLDGPLAWLRMNRPDKANAFNHDLWEEIGQAAAFIDRQPQVRVAILCGEGKHFTAGIDLEVLDEQNRSTSKIDCPARARELILHFIEHAQAAFTRIEQMRVPVIAAVHGACIGAGVDLVAACDLRYATADARFCIKEVDLAVVADVGTLQRLRHIIGLARLTELTYTAETFDGRKAEAIGLTGGTYASRDELFAAAEKMARRIAAKSPLAVRGVKRNLLYARDHTVAEGLQYTATWNAAMLISNDATESLAAYLGKRESKYQD
ncbi:MAG: crotonase/enoyl-CoA hydratase family protein [Nevskia sp.]|nr:crotonase/enoyl-CoA hydratase family protein [Nevskia sp.]